ncbi:stage V sporulation protein AA [Aureibacillus halotolerans]|uniref:Stage V sporulation protein AA n=1 Tax=Aureibacillus halotolerans TaxID=1508390 RepID=A0A4V3D5W5_9BACI|nr:stage V sporulation protein AA [Aureibacillus halotolerans]TDQ41597.1 stage V sporulation protein AA [Aureibacillus halotolerans]
MIQDSIIRMRPHIVVEPNAVVSLRDVAQIITEEPYASDLESLVIHQVTTADRNLVVIDVVKAIRCIRERFPGLPVQSLGATQTIVTVNYKKKRLTPLLFVGVWLLLFIGAGLAIMNFHEDVSMGAVHQKLFYLLTGVENEEPLLLQIPYSIGLGLGMILFFNHIFKKRINEEPSPLEVEMFKYQQDLDQYVAIHENKEIDKQKDAH